MKTRMIRGQMDLPERIEAITVRLSDSTGRLLGTGFFVSPGVVVTCRHVIALVDNIVLQWNGYSCAAETFATSDTADVVLLRAPFPKHPIAALDSECKPGDSVYTFAFSTKKPHGESITAVSEGKSIDPTFSADTPLIKLKGGQVRAGHSGAALLNTRTNIVCGMLALTRNEAYDSGGLGISAEDILNLMRRTQIDTAAAHRDWARFAQQVSTDRVDLAPALDPSFVGRKDALTEVRSSILNFDEEKNVVAVTSVHGLGGIGKTTLVIMLAHDDAIIQRYPDGTLWARLSQTPDIRQWLLGWLDAFGQRPQSEELGVLSALLRQQLRNKRCLIVIDDAWSAADVRPFLVGGERCGTIITTRRKDVADEVGARLHHLLHMNEQEAFALLERRTGRAISASDRRAAREAMDAVENLPLALDQLAVLFKRGKSWNTLSRALQQETQRLEALVTVEERYRGVTPRVEATLRLSIDLLQEEMPMIWRRYLTLAILADDAVLMPSMCATLWQCDNEDAAETLGMLARDALLLDIGSAFGGRSRQKAYRLHDLFRDLIRKLFVEAPPYGVGANREAEQRKYLEACRGGAEGSKPWYRLHDDGYIREHLISHMLEARMLPQVVQLFRSRAWYDVRTGRGNPRGYIKDLEETWNRLQHDHYSYDIRFYRQADLTLALARSSVFSLSRGLAPSLIQQFVRHGLVRPEAALWYAESVEDPCSRALAKIGVARYLKPGTALATLEEVLGELRLVPADGLERVTRSLARALTEKEALQVYCDIAKRCVQPLFRLWTYLLVQSPRNYKFLDRCVESLLANADDGIAAQFLCLISRSAYRLPRASFAAAVAICKRMRGEGDKLWVTIYLLKHGFAIEDIIDDRTLRRDVTQFLVRDVADSERVDVMRELGVLLPHDRARILYYDLAGDTISVVGRAALLAGARHAFTSLEQDEELAMLLAVGERDSSHFDAIVAACASLVSPEREQLKRAFLRSLETCSDERLLMRILRRGGPRVQRSLSRELAHAVARFSSEDAIVTVITSWTLGKNETLLREVGRLFEPGMLLDRALSIQGFVKLASAFAARDTRLGDPISETLARYLSADLGNPAESLRWIARLVAHASADLRVEFSELFADMVIDALESQDVKQYYALCREANRLDSDSLAWLLERILACEDFELQNEMLGLIAPRLPKESIAAYLHRAVGIQDTLAVNDVLTAFGAYKPEDDDPFEAENVPRAALSPTVRDGVLLREASTLLRHAASLKDYPAVKFIANAISLDMYYSDVVRTLTTSLFDTDYIYDLCEEIGSRLPIKVARALYRKLFDSRDSSDWASQATVEPLYAVRQMRAALALAPSLERSHQRPLFRSVIRMLGNGRIPIGFRCDLAARLAVTEGAGERSVAIEFCEAVAFDRMAVNSEEFRVAVRAVASVCWSAHAGYIEQLISGIEVEERLEAIRIAIAAGLGASQFRQAVCRLPPLRRISAVADELDRMPTTEQSATLALAFEAIHNCEPSLYRIDAILHLGLLSPPGMRSELILELIDAMEPQLWISAQFLRAALLISLEPTAVIENAWHQLLFRGCRTQRPEFLEQLMETRVLALSLGGTSLASDVVRAIRTAARIWQ